MGSRSSFYLFITVLCALAYVVGFGVEYLLDPLGRAPVLDADENLVWASRIAQGELPSEPLYRALLYPWVLSLFGSDSTTLAPVATVLGILCHSLNAYLVALLSFRLWEKSIAKWSAGLLYLCYPVALYFSVQVLDMTFAITLFLTALIVALKLDGEKCLKRILLWSILSGFLGGLTVLARPNFLPAVLCLPLIPILLFAWNRDKIACCWPAVVLFLGLCVPLIGQGYYNQSQSGSFRILPWQGAYNLYAANRVGASGQYYTQHVNFETVPEGMNTTRMESELLYRVAHSIPEGSELDIESMNTYWRGQLLTEVIDDPFAWMSLMGRKLIYLFNDWEAYNNLSYPYQKVRFTFLSWNPLGWGVLSLVALSAVYWMSGRIHTRNASALMIVGAAYVVGVLLFFVSARFRLPIAPLICVFCGGIATIHINDLKKASMKRWFGYAGVLLVGGTLTYGNWFEVRDERTFIQDEFLLARANADLGEDEQAIAYANAVLMRDPSRQDARSIQFVSYFNLWLDEHEAGRQVELWRKLNVSLEYLTNYDASSLFIRGIIVWREGDAVGAHAIWAAAVRTYGADAASSAEVLGILSESSDKGETLGQRDELRRLLFSE